MKPKTQDWWEKELEKTKGYADAFAQTERCKAQHDKEMQELKELRLEYIQKLKKETASQIFAEVERLIVKDSYQTQEFEKLKKKYGVK